MKGQSLFEVVVAIGISALIITAIVALVTNSISNSTYSRNQSAADDYAQQLLEWLRGERDNNIQTFLNNIDPNLLKGGSSVYCFEALNWTEPTKKVPCTAGQDEIPGTIFLREANFTNVSQSPNKTVFNAEITVTWTDSHGEHKVTDSTDFSDWRQR